MKTKTIRNGIEKLQTNNNMTMIENKIKNTLKKQYYIYRT